MPNLPPIQPDLPHRFREAAFHEYEPLIRQVLEAQLPIPQVTKFWPRNYGKALSTFACRFRDAMQSYKDHNWDSSLNRDFFLSIHDTLQVSERSDGSVLIGTPKAITHYVRSGSNEIPLSKPIDSADPSFQLDMSLPAHEIVAILSSTRKLSPRLTLKNITLEEVTALQQNYDIAIDQNEDGTFTLI